MMIQAVHCLDAFELRVLACPTPIINLTTLKEAMAILRVYMDNILELRGPELETALVETAEDTVLATLFTTPTSPPPDYCEHAKRHHSSHTTEGDEARARMKERIDLEVASRPSLIDEEDWHMRA